MLRRLGVNLLYLVPREVGGTEIAARRLVAALAAERPELEIVVFCGREAGRVLPDADWPASVRVVVLPVESANKPLRVAAELALLPAAASHHGVELLHSYGTTSPLHGHCPRVVTVHDLIYRAWREAFPPLARRALQVLVPLGARRATRIQVSSQATREEVISVLGVRRTQVDVVPLGPGMRTVAVPTGPDELRSRLGLGEGPVILSVAAALPHKNLAALVEAFGMLGRDEDRTLVLTGHGGRVSAALRAQIAARGLTERVRLTGWLDEADLEGLYRLAALFVYPSLHEGFGMPVLEAMRRGTPVVSSDASALPEVAGDGALLVDARRPGRLEEAMARVLGDASLRENLASRGRARARDFGWDRTARLTLAGYERALAGA